MVDHVFHSRLPDDYHLYGELKTTVQKKAYRPDKKVPEQKKITDTFNRFMYEERNDRIHKPKASEMQLQRNAYELTQKEQREVVQRVKKF